MTVSEAIIAQGTSVRGNLGGDGDLVIEGQVHGSIEIRGQVQLQETSIIESDVVAERILVRGAVKGDLHASDSIVLEAPCRVVGNLHAPRITIAQGALYRGHISMDGAEVTPSKSVAARHVAASPKPRAVPTRTPFRTMQRQTSAQATAQSAAVVESSAAKLEQAELDDTSTVRGVSKSVAKKAEKTVEKAAPPPTLPTPKSRSVMEAAAQHDHSPPPPVVPALKKKAKGAVRKKSAG